MSTVLKYLGVVWATAGVLWLYQNSIAHSALGVSSMVTMLTIFVLPGLALIWAGTWMGRRRGE